MLPVEVEEEVGLRPMSMLSEAECPDLTSTASSSLEKKEEVVHEGECHRDDEDDDTSDDDDEDTDESAEEEDDDDDDATGEDSFPMDENPRSPMRFQSLAAPGTLRDLAAVAVGDRHEISFKHGKLRWPSAASVVNECFSMTGVIVADEEAFDAKWHDALERCFKEARAVAMVRAFQKAGESNGRPLFLQVMCLPPRTWSKVHAHPSIQLAYVLAGHLVEVRKDPPLLLPGPLAATPERPEPKTYDIPSDATFERRRVAGSYPH